MTAALDQSIREIEELGIAPLQQLWDERPAGSKSAWQKQYWQLERAVTTELREAGAIINEGGGDWSIHFGRVTGRSADSVRAALKQWLRRANAKRRVMEEML